MGLLAREKTWAVEILTYTDLNAEFDNILDNGLDPSKIEDESANAGEMQATAVPYTQSTSTEVLATDLRGEIQRLRYAIKQMTGKSQWYIDLDSPVIPRGHYSQLVCSATSNTQVDIDADSIVVENASPNNALYQLTDVNLTLDMATSGANGLSTDESRGTKWYYCWVIYNAITDTVAGLFAEHSDFASLTLPSGYTYGKLVSTVYSDSSTTFKLYTQEGNYLEYTEDVAKPLTDGSAITFTDVSCVVQVPTIGYKIRFCGWASSDGTTLTNLGFWLIPNGSSRTAVSSTKLGLTGATDTTWQINVQVVVGCDSTQKVEYRVSVSDVDLDLNVMGYWIRI